MSQKGYGHLVRSDQFQVFILSSPARFPFVFVRHCWIVTSDRGQLTRWGVGWWPRRRAESWGHVNKNILPPWSGTWAFAGLAWPTFESRLESSFSGPVGSIAEKMVRFINTEAPHYPNKNRYRFPGPNCNSFVRWAIDAFPACGLRLPWNAIGKNAER